MSCGLADDGRLNPSALQWCVASLVRHLVGTGDDHRRRIARMVWGQRQAMGRLGDDVLETVDRLQLLRPIPRAQWRLVVWANW